MLPMMPMLAPLLAKMFAAKRPIHGADPFAPPGQEAETATFTMSEKELARMAELVKAYLLRHRVPPMPNAPPLEPTFGEDVYKTAFERLYATFNEPMRESQRSGQAVGPEPAQPPAEAPPAPAAEPWDPNAPPVAPPPPAPPPPTAQP